jgi:hypothetical protein
MTELRPGRELFLHQQGLDTTTSSGRAMFGMLSVSPSSSAASSASGFWRLSAPIGVLAPAASMGST